MADKPVATVKEYSTYSVKDNVVWVKHCSLVDKETGTKLFSALTTEFATKIDKSQTIFICYDCSDVKILNSEVNGFKETIINFQNSIKHLQTNISLIITNPVVRVIAGTISVVLREKTSFFKSEDEAKAYIRTFKPDYK